MKPRLERVTFPQGCSIRVYHRSIPQIPFEWHHHPEFELTLTLNSRGWRFVADHIGAYSAHDLVLVPSDMPHTWASSATLDPRFPHTAVVVWFTDRWAYQLADLCPEYAKVRSLLRRSARGLSFAPPAGLRMEARLSALLSESASERLGAVLSLLLELGDAEAVPLAGANLAARPFSGESTQLNRILDFLHRHFAEKIAIRDVCSAGNISERSLHRLMTRHLGENLSDCLSRLRIGHACMLLLETDTPISLIAIETGFSNLSNFNRRFLHARRMTPGQFRRFAEEHGRTPESFDNPDLTTRPPSLEKRSEPRTTEPSESMGEWQVPGRAMCG